METNPDLLLKKADKAIEVLGIPKLIYNKRREDIVSLPDLQSMNSDGLAENLSFFGGWRSYIEEQLAQLESKKALLERIYSNKLSISKYTLIKAYKASGEKIPSKENLEDEALVKNPDLMELQERIIVISNVYSRLLGYKIQYQTYCEIISRVITLRVSFKEP